jgi:cell division protein ZapE
MPTDASGGATGAGVSLSDRYRDLVASGRIRGDAEQERVVARLEALRVALAAAPSPRKPGWRDRLGLGPRVAAPAGQRGLYIHGPVGRGKSMLMDLFHEAAELPSRRVHFHAFMLEIHERLHRRRQRQAEADAIGPVAREIAAETRLLCFDEFQVTNIADAMILGRLFAGLFDAAVTVVATSNTAPRDLYAGGLQRERFLPAIALLEERLEILELGGGLDYRRDRIRGMSVYHTPPGPAATRALDRAFADLTGGAVPEPAEIAVQGRILRLSRTAKGVARATFAELCGQPLGPADFLALARAFHTLVLDDVPELTAERRNEVRRFVTLIDALYEHRTKLVCSAAAPPDSLHLAGDHAAEFRRTASRLHEMQSAAYLAAGHQG